MLAGLRPTWGSDRAHLDAVAVGHDLSFGHEIDAADDQMGFDKQIEVAQRC
jgi:hypothetical protein